MRALKLVVFANIIMIGLLNGIVHVHMVGATATLSWGGSTIQKARDCCQGFFALQTTMEDQLEGKWGPGAQERTSVPCFPERGVPNLARALCSADTDKDSWIVEQFDCDIDVDTSKPNRPVRPQSTLVSDLAVDRCQGLLFQAELERNLPSGTLVGPGNSQSSIGTRRSPRPSTLKSNVRLSVDPISSVLQSAFTTQGDKTVTVNGCAGKLSNVPLCAGAPGGWHSLSLTTPLSVSSASVNTNARTSSFVLSLTGNAGVEYTGDCQTFCHGGPAGGCTTICDHHKCCNSNSWANSPTVSFSYVCDETGAHSFTRTSITSTGVSSADTAIQATVDSSLASISISKAGGASVLWCGA